MNEPENEGMELHVALAHAAEQLRKAQDEPTTVDTTLRFLAVIHTCGDVAAKLAEVLGNHFAEVAAKGRAYAS